jgi:hypothetical protein
MQVFVGTLSGKSLCIDVDPHHSIGQTLARIQATDSFQMNKILLLFERYLDETTR